VTLIKGYEQTVSLPYNAGGFNVFSPPDSCEISEIWNVEVTTPCDCSSGSCKVGVTPMNSKTSGNFTYTLSNNTLTETHRTSVKISDVVPFVSTWRIPGGDLDFSLPLVIGGRYDFTVDWGDGSSSEITAFNDPDIDHTYASAGDYVITMSGHIEAIKLSATLVSDKLISVSELGTVGWRILRDAFRSCTNLTTLEGGDTSNVEDMNYMFYGALNADPNTSSWNTSRVTRMVSMFRDTDVANPDTSNWDVSHVVDMSQMFNDATVATPDTQNWNTESLLRSNFMFYGALVANPDVSGWNTQSLFEAEGMFGYAAQANPDTSNWDFSLVTNIEDFMLNANNLSSENYDALLVSLNATARDNLTIDVGDATTATADGDNAKAALEARGWTITDGMP
tara:strand:+ start:34981 stop:36162 length:1182 start_codon:yes stop_codon:yes gene_type:complete